MTIEQRGIVDLISIPPQGDVAYLIVSDHLEWDGDDNKHCLLIQDKINEYLSFIEGGTLLEARSDLSQKRLVLKVIGLYQPSDRGGAFYEKLREVLANAGYPFIFELRSESQAG